MNLIKRLPANLEGRDFVCADIHGSFSCVERFLREISFDETKDRLICSGDLIDRGPENVKCLELLYKPWFYMVKGNHEDLMQSFFQRKPLGNWWFPNGGVWGMQYANEYSDDGDLVRDAALEIIPKLPLLITVERPGGGVFHVLHAEIYPDGEDLTDEIFADEQKFSDLAFRQTLNGEVVMWGRFLFAPFYKKDIDKRTFKKMARGSLLERKDRIFNDKLSHIYSGHTSIKTPIQFFGQTNLDTMAYASYTDNEEYAPWCGLSVTEPATGKFWLVNDREFKEVQPLIFNHSTCQGE